MHRHRCATLLPRRAAMTIDTGSRDAMLRERAIKRLRKRRDFYRHVLAYVLVNGFLVVIWAVTGEAGTFWPIFPMVGWGVGVIMNAWDVSRDDEVDETSIEQEMRRLQKRSPPRQAPRSSRSGWLDEAPQQRVA